MAFGLCDDNLFEAYMALRCRVKNQAQIIDEFKSGKRYSINSLTRFQEKYKSRIGECYIIHPRNLIIKDNIVCIPAYMTFCL